MPMRGILKAILNSKLMLSGFIMVFLAMILSAVAVFHVGHPSYSSSGVLEPGNHTLGNSTFENNYFYYNRTLSLSSKNATVELSWGNFTGVYNLTGNATFVPTDRPEVRVINGTVTYTYRAKAISYPYSDLAIPAAILAFAGTVFLWVGYAHALKGRRRK
ncbi:hypothetical protein [Thermococcus sp.]|uniref:hypothetical protein n=1 Tax=Thermococcus sp. TaxID=35749 RepID=UPI002611EC9A|nr:hypothetical protein [Thermococcus sp.]